MLQPDIKGIQLLQDEEKNMFKRILTLLWLMFLVFIFLPSVSTALTGGPDKGGYSYYDSYEKGAAKFEWNEVSAISIGFKEDKTLILYGPVSIGFKFKFHGNTYDKVYISRYGYITFNEGPAVLFNQDYQPQQIPTDGKRAFENSADNFIAGMWTHLESGA